MKNIVISTGGSGGHVKPAIALYEYLEKDNKVHITTDKRGLIYLKKYNSKFKIINLTKLNFTFLKIIQFVGSFAYSLVQSIFYLTQKKINIVISTGGYMSLPVCIAAKIINIKIYLLEPNQVIGRSNLFFLRHCEKILTYEDNIKNFPKKFKEKIVKLKPLMKKQIFNLKNNENNKKKFSILIIGGSQAALKFDELFNEPLSKLAKEYDIFVYHQTSENNINNLKNFYLKHSIEHELFFFKENLYEIFINCNFAITRAGASTINELVFLKVPFLAIPFPHAKDDHQFFNAEYYYKKNMCWLKREKEISSKNLYDFLENLIKNKNFIEEKKRNMIEFNKSNNWDHNLKILKKIFNNENKSW